MSSSALRADFFPDSLRLCMFLAPIAFFDGHTLDGYEVSPTEIANHAWENELAI